MAQQLVVEYGIGRKANRLFDFSIATKAAILLPKGRGCGTQSGSFRRSLGHAFVKRPTPMTQGG
jgi:hypothetical protein